MIAEVGVGSQPKPLNLEDFECCIHIAANPPECFVIIRKSELEYEFPNDELCLRIMKIRQFFYFFYFFLPPVFRRRHSTSTCRNQHSCAFSDFVLQRMRCRLQFASCSCACAPFSSASGGTPPHEPSPILQLQGARPPPEPSPIRNDKLCRLAAMHTLRAAC